MKTHLLKINNKKNPESKKISLAAEILRHGNILAFPTETVYGLGARLSDIRAIKKIFKAKKRPPDNPLIVHVAKAAEAAKVAEVTQEAKKLMKKFWPGPLTLVLKKKPIVPKIVTAGLSSVGIRMPNNSIALALLKAAGEPVVAPSANTAGKPSPTLAQDVYNDLRGRIPLIIDGGPTNIGLESTVLDLTHTPPAILRPGAVTHEQLKKILPSLSYPNNPNYLNNPNHPSSLAPLAPGMKYRHYAPKAKIVLIRSKSPVRPIMELIKKYRSQGKKVGIMATSETKKQYHGASIVISVGSRKNLASVAKNLFSTLRAFDQRHADIILAEGFPKHGIGEAIMNRLEKSASLIIK
jgi:L-threonylcarbamoyladenylate synthase